MTCFPSSWISSSSSPTGSRKIDGTTLTLMVLVCLSPHLGAHGCRGKLRSSRSCGYVNGGICMPSHGLAYAVCTVVGTVLYMTSHVWPADVRLTWDAPGSADGMPQEVAGYNIYYGLARQRYDFVLDVGDQTTYTLSGLRGGQQYYLSVVAYDYSLNESPLSEEVMVLTPDE